MTKVRLLNVGGPNTSPLEYGAGVSPEIMKLLNKSAEEGLKLPIDHELLIQVAAREYGDIIAPLNDPAKNDPAKLEELFGQIINYGMTTQKKTRFQQSIQEDKGNILNNDNLNNFVATFRETDTSEKFKTATKEFIKKALEVVKDSESPKDTHYIEGGCFAADNFLNDDGKPNTKNELYISVEQYFNGDHSYKATLIRQYFFRLGFVVGQLKILNYLKKFLTEETVEEGNAGVPPAPKSKKQIFIEEVLPNLVVNIKEAKKTQIIDFLSGMRDSDVLLLNESEIGTNEGGTNVTHIIKTKLDENKFQIVNGTPNDSKLASVIAVKVPPSYANVTELKRLEDIEESIKGKNKSCIAEIVAAQFNGVIYLCIHCNSHSISKGSTKRTKEIKDLLKFIKEKIEGPVVLGIDTNDFNFTTGDLEEGGQEICKLLAPNNINESKGTYLDKLKAPEEAVEKAKVNLKLNPGDENLKEKLVKAEEGLKKAQKKITDNTFFSAGNYTVFKMRTYFQAQASKANILDMCTKDLVLGFNVESEEESVKITPAILNMEKLITELMPLEEGNGPKTEVKSVVDKNSMHLYPSEKYPFDHASVEVSINPLSRLSTNLNRKVMTVKGVRHKGPAEVMLGTANQPRQIERELAALRAAKAAQAEGGGRTRRRRQSRRQQSRSQAQRRQSRRQSERQQSRRQQRRKQSRSQAQRRQSRRQSERQQSTRNQKRRTQKRRN